MGRITIEGKWFEQIEPSTLKESEFEQYINLFAPHVYPAYYVCPFKQRIATVDLSSEEIKDTTVVPDLVFISRDYSEWWIVEVEMTYHSLTSHVLPQVMKLREGTYDTHVVDYLCSKHSELDKSKLSELILNHPGQILIIANEHKSEWETKLKFESATLALFEIFHSEETEESTTTQTVVRVDGRYPSIIVEKISECVFHPTDKNLISVESPDYIRLPTNRIIRLRFNNCITEWRRIDALGKIWLRPLGRSVLNEKKKYQIYLQNDNSLVLTKIE